MTRSYSPQPTTTTMPSPPPPPPLISKVSIPSSLSRINEHWKPKLVGSINGQTEIKVVKLKGEFVWHDHQNTDEVFHLLAGGPLTIQFRKEDGGDVVLQVGEMLVIPKGVQHCPKAENECSVLLIEGVGTVNDGEAESTFKAVVEDFRSS